MAIVVQDVRDWLGDVDDEIDETILTRICATVDDWADEHYDVTDPTDQVEQALIEIAGYTYQRRHATGESSGSDFLTPLPRFIPRETLKHLMGRLKTAGIFGPSANVVEA
jgi:hypothetical protein